MGTRSKKLSKYLPHISVSRRRFNKYNPAAEPERKPMPTAPVYSIFSYNDQGLTEQKLLDYDWHTPVATDKITWINVDGLYKDCVEHLCEQYQVHPLLVEDILSVGQRAKMDEVDNRLFCLLPMIYFNPENNTVEMEQVSMVIGPGFLLSFQEDALRDVFNPLRDKLRNGTLRIRERGADYLCYSLLDVIVDSYFGVIDQLGESIEAIESKLIHKNEQGVLEAISAIRKEVMLMKRAIVPVRELINGFLRTDNSLIEARNEKYFKDVSDHIIQANENCDNLRDLLVNLQDMYMNQINLRMNEVMKIFTMVSLLLAPATVIGGVFGMNFEQIPLLHNPVGFYFSVSAMLITPLLMLVYFKKKKWF